MNPSWFLRTESGQEESRKLDAVRLAERAKAAEQLRATEARYAAVLAEAGKRTSAAQAAFNEVQAKQRQAFADLQDARRSQFRLSAASDRESEPLCRQLVELSDPAVDSALGRVSGRIAEVQRTNPVTPAESRRAESELSALSAARAALEALRGSPLDGAGVVLELRRIAQTVPVLA